MLTASWLVDLALLTVTFWGLLYWYSSRKFDYWKIRKIPFVKPLPFFGNALEVFIWRKSIGDLCHSIYRKTAEPLIGMFVCDEPYLLVRDPELIKSILVKDFSIFDDRTISDNKTADPMGAHILFILKNPDWKQIRQKITPIFTSGRLKSMHKLISKSAEELVEYMNERVAEGGVVDIRDASAKYTTDSITSTSFGIEANSFKDPKSEFRQVSSRVFNFSYVERALATTLYFISPTLVQLFGLKFIDKASSDFLREAFWKTMHERERSRFVRNDLLDILIEMKANESADDLYKLDGDKLVAQATMFFIAGFETSSTTISFTMYELARNPDIQETLRREVLDVREHHKSITFDALKEMNYLDMCVKETLRKYPVLPFLDRRCNSDWKIPGTDAVLKKGSAVFISTVGLHYDPQYFPEPDRYDPERFLKERVEERPAYTYLPFGEGPRNCIGARFGTISTKSAIAHIISQFEVETCDQTPEPMILDPKGFLIAPIGGLRLKFKKIDQGL